MVGTTALHVLIDGEHAGLLVRGGERLTFTYDDDYRSSPNATPLSTNLPLGLQVHADEPVLAYIDGLLPDNDAVRQRWAAEFQTRDRPFELLAEVGEDCAGAVQLVRDDRVGRIDPGGVSWLTSADIGDWIRQLRVDPTGWLQDAELGQFSLAGAQSKFALLRDGRRWGRPHGAVPTTHIVKPAIAGFGGHEINEHLSLTLARAVGLSCARSQIVEFDRERAVVVERFDRFPVGDRVRRVHQEDMCQATGLRPGAKYESRGGPSAAAIVGVLRNRSASPDEDVDAFIDALIFNWLIANTDAHAKNYSLLVAGGRVRLAPLYDLASALPYVARSPTGRRPGELTSSRLSLAMSVAGVYRLAEIRRRDFERLFDLLGVDRDAALQRTQALVEAVRAALPMVVAPVAAAFDGPMPARFEQAIQGRLGLCRDVLAGRPATGRRR